MMESCSKLEGGLSTIDEKGNVLPEVLEILKIAKEKNGNLFGEHWSRAECALSKKTKDIEIPFFLNHAISEARPDCMPISKLKGCAENGAYIEIDVMHTPPSFTRRSPMQKFP